MTIRTATTGDLPALTELCRRANDTPYDLARVVEEKCFGEGLAGPPRTRIYGECDGLAVTCGKYLRLLAVDPEHRGRGIGARLLRDAIAAGARIAGAEPGNYFTPGVPESLAPFLERHGYRETAFTHNMEVSLAELDATEVHPDVRRARAEDRERLLAFVEQHFGAAWRFECEPAFAHSLPRLFLFDNDGSMGGFAAIDGNNRGLGFFGPTGVAAPLRGRGIGRHLLLAALADLRRLGHERAVIPWTDALEFYRKSCGAVVTERFVTMSTEGSGE